MIKGIVKNGIILTKKDIIKEAYRIMLENRENELSTCHDINCDECPLGEAQYCVYIGSKSEEV